MTLPVVECAVVCPTGQVLRLVDDDGPAAAEWVLLDPVTSARSRRVPLAEAVRLAGPAAAQVVWAALCLRLVGGAGSDAVVGLSECQLDELQRYWLRYPAGGAPAGADQLGARPEGARPEGG